MLRFRLLLALGLAAVVGEAGQARKETPGLEYWAHIQVQGESLLQRVRFRLEPSRPRVTRNKVQKPRLAPWRLVVLEASEGASGAMLLARVEPLLYLAGPAPGMAPSTEGHRKDGSHSGRLWNLTVPPAVQLRAELLEVQRGLLAVHHLEGSLPDRGIQQVHLDLARVRLAPRTAPAELGTRLLATLQRAAAGTPGAEKGTGPAIIN